MLIKKHNSFIAAGMLWVQALSLTGMPLSAQADVTAVQRSAPLFNPLGGPSYPITQDSYFTDDYGNILMYVNVLGEVVRSGQFVVRENVDFSTILALSGGLKPEANLKKVLVIRREPDDNGKQAYVINLKSFYKKGDRSHFIALKPNDTIVIPDKSISLAKISRAIGTVYPLIYLYDLLDRN